MTPGHRCTHICAEYLAGCGCVSNQPAPLRQQGLAKAEAAGADLSVLVQHFSLDQVVDGLGRLTRQLMGVALEERPMRPGVENREWAR